MKAVRIHEPGGPDVLRLEELPTPVPGPGQALVSIEAAGVNFIDIYYRTGQYQMALPATLGQEGSGSVEAIGDGVTDVTVGDRVAWSGVLGAYADHALVPADRLVHLPSHLDARQGAATMLQGMTAHYLAFSTAHLETHDVCLVHAAAGGVGQLLCQLLKMRGARVIGTVSTETKAQIAREAGADDVILYTEQDFEPVVKRLTDGRGVAVVFDSVGCDTFEKSLNCVRTRGSLVLYGASSGPAPPVDPQVLNAKGSIWLTRPSIVHYTATRAELCQRAEELFDWIASGKVRLRIDRTYPLAEAAGAHRALSARETMGKILLTP
ncbi:MAG: zinc-binding dehydrogenase [Chloroflexi bacterium]|nr:zinc-binding dehydrogenase [Chloroflexota bacterium]